MKGYVQIQYSTVIAAGLGVATICLPFVGLAVNIFPSIGFGIASPTVFVAPLLAACSTLLAFVLAAVGLIGGNTSSRVGILACVVSVYVVGYWLATFAIPTKGLRARGFIRQTEYRQPLDPKLLTAEGIDTEAIAACNPEKSDLELLRDCVNYDPYKLWIPWTVRIIELTLLLTWCALFGCIASVVASATFEKHGRRSVPDQSQAGRVGVKARDDSTSVADLISAVCQAFTIQEITELLHGLPHGQRTLQSVNLNRGLRAVVFDVICAYDRLGAREEFLKAISDARPLNDAIQDFATKCRECREA